MKWIFLALLASTQAYDVGFATSTISKVVGFLREMEEHSAADLKARTEMAAKMKCECDSKRESYTKTIEDKAAAIAEHEATMEELRADTNAKSIEVGQSQRDKKQAELDLDAMQKQRNKENAKFIADDLLMVKQRGQLMMAIKTLQDVGADQTSDAPAADSQTYIKGNALVMVRKTLDQIRGNGFIQVPGGTYSAQSGEIVGILKQFLDQTVADMKNNKETEDARADAFKEYKKSATDLIDTLRIRIGKLSLEIGDNTGNLENTKTAHTVATGVKDNAEKDLADSEQKCARQAKVFEDVKALKAQEAAAIAQAIAILNADESFDAAKAEERMRTTFLQVSKKKMSPIRKEALKLLSTSSGRNVSKVRSLLRSGNPFKVILAEIEKMQKTIEDEGKLDQETHDKYDQDMKDTEHTINQSAKDVRESEANMNAGKQNIKDLEDQIGDLEKQLGELKTSASDENTKRLEAYKTYIAEVNEINTTQKVLKEAISVLEKFYDMLSRRSGKHKYIEKGGTCAGDVRGKQLRDVTVDEAKADCTAEPGCEGFYLDPTTSTGYTYNTKADTCMPSDGTSYTKTFDQKEMDAMPDVEVSEAVSTVNADRLGNADLEQHSQSQNYKSSASKSGVDGQGIISLLEGIQSEGMREMEEECDEEEADQAEYEQFTQKTNKMIRETKRTIAAANERLAEAKSELADMTATFEAATDTNEAATTFKADIQAPTDFWRKNLTVRQKAQKAESTQLKNVVNLLKGSNAYKNAAYTATRAEWVEKHGKECAKLKVANRNRHGDNHQNTIEEEACTRGTTVKNLCAGELKDDALCAMVNAKLAQSQK